MAAHALRTLLLALALGLSGCRGDGPLPQGPRRIPTAPTRAHVYEAVVRLGSRMQVLYKTWPAHLARSNDDPNVPRVDVREVDNRGEIDGVDLEALGWELVAQLRTQGQLALLSDESNAVASHGASGAPQLGSGNEDAGLVLYPWIDSAGRFCLVLQDEVQDKALIVVRSDMPEEGPQPE